MLENNPGSKEVEKLRALLLIEADLNFLNKLLISVRNTRYV